MEKLEEVVMAYYKNIVPFMSSVKGKGVANRAFLDKYSDLGWRQDWNNLGSNLRYTLKVGRNFTRDLGELASRNGWGDAAKKAEIIPVQSRIIILKEPLCDKCELAPVTTYNWWKTMGYREGFGTLIDAFVEDQKKAMVYTRYCIGQITANKWHLTTEGAEAFALLEGLIGAIRWSFSCVSETYSARDIRHLGKETTVTGMQKQWDIPNFAPSKVMKFDRELCKECELNLIEV